MVTGMVSALGKMKRIAGRPARSSSCNMGTKSLASAPRPCIQIMATVGWGPVSFSMVSSRVLMAFLLSGGGDDAIVLRSLPPASAALAAKVADAAAREASEASAARRRIVQAFGAGRSADLGRKALQ